MPSDLQVSNIKANDGTAGISIADSTGNVSLSGTLSAGTIGSSVVVPGSVGSSLVLLNTTTISSAVAHVSFDNTLITTTYNAYRVIFTGVGKAGTADNFDFYCQFSNDNGSSTISYESVYDYKGINVSSEGTSAGQAYHRLWFDAESENTDASGAGYVDFILSPETGTGVDCHAFSATSVENANGTFYGYWTIGISVGQSSTARVNHIKFRDADGVNLDAGKFHLYGFKF